MRNPLRSEGDMFRLLLYVIAVFGTDHRDHRYRPRAALSVRAARRRRRSQPPRPTVYLTVRVPNIPAARWPGTWQKKV